MGRRPALRPPPGSAPSLKPPALSSSGRLRKRNYNHCCVRPNRFHKRCIRREDTGRSFSVKKSCSELLPAGRSICENGFPPLRSLPLFRPSRWSALSSPPGCTPARSRRPKPPRCPRRPITSSCSHFPLTTAPARPTWTGSARRSRKSSTSDSALPASTSSAATIASTPSNTSACRGTSSHRAPPPSASLRRSTPTTSSSAPTRCRTTTCISPPNSWMSTRFV